MVEGPPLTHVCEPLDLSGVTPPGKSTTLCCAGAEPPWQQAASAGYREPTPAPTRRRRGGGGGDRELAFDQLVPNLSECKFFGLVSGGDGPIKIELAARVHIVGLFDVVDETKWDRLPPMSRTLQDKYRQIAETRSPLTRTAAKDPHQEQRGPPMWKQKACTARMTLLLAAYDFYTKADTASGNGP